MLASILRRHRCYPVLDTFVDIFKKLEDKGCKLGEEVLAIRAIAAHSATSLKEVNLEGIGLKTRRKFGDCPLWDDYMCCRIKSLLAAAKIEKPGEKRNALLAAGLNVARMNVPGMEEGVSDDATIAGSLFDTNIPRD